MTIKVNGKVIERGNVAHGPLGKARRFEYTGDVQTFSAAGRSISNAGTYKVYAWGGGGGSGRRYDLDYQGPGGVGGAVTDILTLNPGDTWYLYVGEGGAGGTMSSTDSADGGGFGGRGAPGSSPYPGSGGGGGSTEIHLNSENASDDSRILIAAGGGGSGGGQGGDASGGDGEEWGGAYVGFGGGSSTRNGNDGNSAAGFGAGGAGGGGLRGGSGGQSGQNAGAGGGAGTSKATDGWYSVGNTGVITNNRTPGEFTNRPYNTHLAYYEPPAAVPGRGFFSNEGTAWADGQAGNDGLIILIKIENL